MKELIMDGIFPILLGFFCILSRSRAARSAVEWNYRILGVKFNEQGYKIFSVIAGSLLIIIGVLRLLLDVLRFKYGVTF